MTFSPAQEPISGEALQFNPGEKFGERYTIIEEIGQGGMGRVYKANDQELGTTVVLKMIRPELSSRPGMIDQFRKETLLGRSVSHENVVRIHDIGEIDKVRYISMDFIKGENLGELIQTSGTLTLSTCLHIATQVCQALRAAHKNGIVHQDLKPQNIMIGKSGRVFVMDFGLAKSVGTSQAHRPGKTSGTPKYFSPEQALGKESDSRSDIYSLGVILYEMVTGDVPFKADGVDGYIRKHAFEKPPLPSKLNPNLSLACERIILKCLEKKREDRYQSVDDLLQDLEIQKDRPLGGIGRPNKWLQKLAAAALILIVGAIIFKWIMPLLRLPRSKGQPLIAVMYAVNNTGDRALDDQLRWPIPHYLSTFLAQSKYLRVMRPDRLMSILSDMNQLNEDRHYSKMLDRISETANVSHFLLPSFTIAGDDLWISISVMMANTDVAIGEPDIVKGKKEGNIPALVEELSQKVKSKLNISPEEIAGDYNESLARITTNSPEALRHYIDGEKYYAQRDYEASIKALELAVREDPNFAMAYLKMAENYDYLGDYGNHRSNLLKAKTFLARVSARDRYIIQGYTSSLLDESPLKAVESYQLLLELYPNDEEGRTLLGAIHRNLEEWELALEQFNRILDLNPGNQLALENKVFIYTAKGLYDTAMDLCDPRLTTHPKGRFFIRQRALLYLIQGRFDLAAAEIEKALAMMPDDNEILELKGHLLHLKGELPPARRLYEQIQTSGEAAARDPNFAGRIWQTHLLIEQGEYREARTVILDGIELAKELGRVFDEIDLQLLLASSELQCGHFSQAAEAVGAVFEIIRENNVGRSRLKALHLSGLASLGMGRIEEAKRIGLDLRLSIERERFPKGMRFYDHLMGHIALAEGRTDQAVRLFEHAISLLPYQRENTDEQALYESSLAKGYYLLGHWSQALETYQGISSLTTGRLQWGDIYAKSYYWRAKIYLKNGDNAAAASHFENFLRLWKDADSGLPEVDDARNQLEALKKAP